MRSGLSAAAIFSSLRVASLEVGPASAGQPRRPDPPPVNVDISQRHTNESEEAIAVNPTNPQNVVMVTNIDVGAAGLFEGVSFDGGDVDDKLTPTVTTLAMPAATPACRSTPRGTSSSPTLQRGERAPHCPLSTDGGLHFHLIANIPRIGKRNGKRAGEKGLFRFVDQPTITAAEGEVWVVVNVGGPMGASGAPVTGLGQVGTSRRPRSSPARTIAPTATSPSVRPAR